MTKVIESETNFVAVINRMTDKSFCAVTFNFVSPTLVFCLFCFYYFVLLFCLFLLTKPHYRYIKLSKLFYT